MRGAVSVALAYYYFDIEGPHTSSSSRRCTLIVTTLAVVLFTVLVFGACMRAGGVGCAHAGGGVGAAWGAAGGAKRHTGGHVRRLAAWEVVHVAPFGWL